MNLPEKLVHEIVRVSKLRERYVALKDMPGVNVAPALYMMDCALENAKRAAGMDDAIEQMRAIGDLESFTD